MADHRASYRQIAAVAIALLLGLAGPIFGQTTLQTTPDAGASIRSLAQPDPHLYRSEEAGSPIENLGTLFTRKIVPALPGAGLLLLLSTMFSSINFYSEVRGEQRSLARTWKYLLFWVTVNYTFSLILLFLILPEKLSLANVT